MGKNILVALVALVAVVVVLGAVLHSLLLPALPLPEWLAAAVAAVIAYVLGLKYEATVGALRGLKGKK